MVLATLPPKTGKRARANGLCIEARGLSFLWLKIQLYSYALHDGMLPPSAKTEFILRGFEASFHFLETFSLTVSNTPNRMLPALHPFSAVCSWMFVFKALFSRYRMYLDVGETEKALVDAQQVMSSSSQFHGDFCWGAAVYMDNLLQDAKANAEQSLGDPYLRTRSRMAASLYYDGLAHLAHLAKSRESPNFTLETKILLSPPSVQGSSFASSPFLSSDDLSTPPASQHPPPSFAPIEKPNFSDINWSHEQAVDNTYVPDASKIDMEWLADSFLTGEGGVAPSDVSKYVSPGLLMAQ